MDKDSKFDLILTETFFIQELFVTFGHKFNAPVINFHATEPTTLACECTGNPNPYSYIPRKMMGMTDHMSYLERLLNTVGNLMEMALIHLHYIPLQVILYIPLEQWPHKSILEYVTSVICIW
jgi:glucuronosyltransferase